MEKIRKETFDSENEKEMPKFIISVASKMIGMHPQTLRQYEKRGFLNPFRLGNLRLYSENDIKVLFRIKELAENGIPTLGIEKIIELEKIVKKMEKTIEELERENFLLKERYRKEIPPLPVKIEYTSYKVEFIEDED